ncbi:MAG: hypothetical protein HRU19_18750 [Pseudobacteriovorax sp.]|nr:hypothetical protein [Pseudobacteriovorax sp.]
MDLFYYVLLAFTSVGSASLVAGELCLKPKDAKAGLIYLHGLDDNIPGNQELRNRKTLKHISKTLGVAIYAHRSQITCKRYNKKCWLHSTPQQRTQAWNKILPKAKACFAETPVTLLLGFSNGAYLAAKLFEDCLVPSNVVTVFSGGMGSKAPPWNKPSCKRGKIIGMIGKGDQIKAKAERYIQNAKKAGQDARLLLHKGGHEILAPPLSQIITQH